MPLNRLQKLKKNSSEEGKVTNTDRLVIGGDLFSYMLLEKLPEGTTILIPQIDLTAPMGPTTLRGEENFSILSDLFPNIDQVEFEESPAFFRDQRFRDFEGRSKPEKIFPGEEYFTKPGKSIDWETLIGVPPKEHLELLPTEILFGDDLFTIKCSNGEKIVCKELYWARDPSILGQLIDKNHPLQKYCQQINPLCTLHINYQLSGVVESKRRTFFIPVSYTHDWGHFIGELKGDGTQFEFIYLFDKSDISEDELTKRIKILKRSVEKIFPEIATYDVEEEIIVRDHAAVTGINDELYSPVSGLYITGVNAPLQEKKPGASHLARALKSILEVSSRES